jgi:hypothetical protein
LSIGGNKGPRGDAPYSEVTRPREAEEDSSPAIQGLGPASDSVELSRRSSAGSSCKWRSGKPNSQRNTLQFAQKADAFIGAVAWSYSGKPAEPGNGKQRKLRGSSTSQKYAGRAGDSAASQNLGNEHSMTSRDESWGGEMARDGRRHKPLPTPDPTSTPDIAGVARTPVFAVSPAPA